MSEDSILDALRAAPPIADPLRLPERRAALLERAAVVPGRYDRRRAIGWGVALAGLIAIGSLLRRDPEIRPNPKPSLTISGEASYSRDRLVGLTGEPRERIRLESGELELRVAVEQAFVLETEDASLEAIGHFLVRAEDGALVEVVVLEGAAMVRPQGAEAQLISVGHRWSPEPKPAAAALVEVKVAAPPPRARPKRPPPEASVPPIVVQPIAPIVEPSTVPRPEPTRAELAFLRGWRAFEAKHFDEAIAELREASRDGGEIGEDATYWYARALRDAGRSAESRRAFEDLITRFPRASRIDEAHLMVGAQLLDEGRPDDARPHLETAARSPRAIIRKPAKTRLEAIDE